MSIFKNTHNTREIQTTLETHNSIRENNLQISLKNELSDEHEIFSESHNLTDKFKANSSCNISKVMQLKHHSNYSRRDKTSHLPRITSKPHTYRFFDTHTNKYNTYILYIYDVLTEGIQFFFF